MMPNIYHYLTAISAINCCLAMNTRSLMGLTNSKTEKSFINDEWLNSLIAGDKSDDFEGDGDPSHPVLLPWGSQVINPSPMEIAPSLRLFHPTQTSADAVSNRAATEAHVQGYQPLPRNPEATSESYTRPPGSLGSVYASSSAQRSQTSFEREITQIHNGLKARPPPDPSHRLNKASRPLFKPTKTSRPRKTHRNYPIPNDRNSENSPGQRKISPMHAQNGENFLFFPEHDLSTLTAQRNDPSILPFSYTGFTHRTQKNMIQDTHQNNQIAESSKAQYFDLEFDLKFLLEKTKELTEMEFKTRQWLKHNQSPTLLKFEETRLKPVARDWYSALSFRDAADSSGIIGKSGTTIRETIVRQKAESFARNYDTWRAYFSQKKRFRLAKYLDKVGHLNNNLCKSSFLLFLFYVEMISKIVPEKDTNGEIVDHEVSLEQACEKVFEMNGSSRSDTNSISDSEATSQKKALELNARAKRVKTINKSTVWKLITFWLNSCRYSLHERIDSKKDVNGIFLPVKAFFNSLFCLMIQHLTEKLKIALK